MLHRIQRILDNYERQFPLELDVVSSAKAALADLVAGSTPPVHVSASALALREEDNMLAAVLHPTLGTWIQPGGHVEIGESPAMTARRELEEETNLSGVTLHRWHLEKRSPIDIDVHDTPCHLSQSSARHLDFRYVFWVNQPTSNTDLVRWIQFGDVLSGRILTNITRALGKTLELHLLRPTD